jgi:hypothetical protein
MDCRIHEADYEAVSTSETLNYKKLCSSASRNTARWKTFAVLFRVKQLLACVICINVVETVMVIRD